MFEFRDPQGRVPLAGTTAYRVLIALYRNALTSPPPKLKKGEVRVVNNGDLKQGDIIKGVQWLRTWAGKSKKFGLRVVRLLATGSCVKTKTPRHAGLFIAAIADSTLFTTTT